MMSKTQTTTNTAVQKIENFKNLYSRMPVNNKGSNNTIFEHFSGFIHSYLSFIETNDETTTKKFGEKYNFHLNKLWGAIHDEFHDLTWHYDRRSGVDISSLNQLNTMEKLKPGLRLALSENKNTEFFKTYPYIIDLLFIDRCLSSETITEPEKQQLFNLIRNYQAAINKYDFLLHILVLQEHIHLMQSRDEFDREFYSKHMKGANQCLAGDPDKLLLFFAAFVNNRTIPHSVRSSDVGFKKFNWNALDGLYKAVLDRTFSTSVSNDDLINTLQQIQTYLEKLILFEVGEVAIDEVPEVNLEVLSKINTATNLKPAFEIIEHYLDIAQSIHNTDSTSRLATLRVITAIGEAIFVIKSLIPDDKIGLLEKLNDLRDHILHSSTNESFKYLSDLVYNGDNKTLDNILTILLKLKGFFHELKEWFGGDRSLDAFPIVPDLSDIETFEAKYAANRLKDDRDVKLSLADYQILQNSIPIEDVRDNKSLDIVSDFVNCKKWIDRNKFVESCIGSKDPVTGNYRTNSQLKKIYDQFCELNKIRQILSKMNEPDFDFNYIKLNLGKSAKTTLEKIKKEEDRGELEKLLFKHEIAKFININKFLVSIKTLDLTIAKETLNKFVEEKSITEAEFSQAVQVVFRGHDSAQENWNNAYKKYHGDMVSFKRDHATQVDFAIQSIEALKNVANTIYIEKRIKSDKDPVAALACEMQFGLCTNNIKNVSKFIDRMFDYTDESLYFIALPHPINETKNILELMVTARNDLFHFERIFNGPLTIEGHRMRWFSILENLTHGMFFPEAIIITPRGVSKEPKTSDSNLLKLKKYFELVKVSLLNNDSDNINIYELITSDATDVDLSTTVIRDEEEENKGCETEDAIAAGAGAGAGAGASVQPVDNQGTGATDLIGSGNFFGE